MQQAVHKNGLTSAALPFAAAFHDLIEECVWVLLNNFANLLSFVTLGWGIEILQSDWQHGVSNLLMMECWPLKKTVLELNDTCLYQE